MAINVFFLVSFVSGALTPAPREDGQWVFVREPYFLIPSVQSGPIHSIISSPQTDMVFFCSVEELWSISKKKKEVAARVKSSTKVRFLGGHVSSDAKQLNLICSDGELRRYSAETLKQIDSTKVCLQNSYDVISYSGGGTRVVCYSYYNKDLEVHRIDRFNTIRKVVSPLQRNATCCFSSKYGRMFLGGTVNVSVPNDRAVLVEGMLLVIDVHAQELVETIPVADGYINCMAPSVDEEIVAVGNSAGKVFVCNAKSGKQTVCFDSGKDVISALSFSSDSRFLFVGSYSLGLRGVKSTQVQLWNLATKKLVGEHEIGTTIVSSLLFDSSTRLLYVGTRNGGCSAFSLERSKER